MNDFNQFNLSPDQSKPTLKQMVREMEQTSNWKIIEQKHDQDEVVIEGQAVELPFTNMSGFMVIIQKDKEGQWKYVDRARKEELTELLAVYYNEIRKK